MEVVGSTLNRQPSQGFAAILALRDAVWRSGSPAPSERWPLRTSTCVEINQCDGPLTGVFYRRRRGRAGSVKR